MELKNRPEIEQNKKLKTAYDQFNHLLSELEKRELPEEILKAIHHEIEEINSISGSEKELSKQIRRTQAAILKLIEKELKLVPINHYRNTWLAIGMAAFGVPLGIALGTSIGNMGLIGIGLPIGMVIGIAVGTNLDKKALEAGLQLDIEIK